MSLLTHGNPSDSLLSINSNPSNPVLFYSDNPGNPKCEMYGPLVTLQKQK